MIVSNPKANLDVGSVDSNHTLLLTQIYLLQWEITLEITLIFNGHNKLDVTSGDIELALKDYTLNVQADSHSGEVDITNNLKNLKG